MGLLLRTTFKEPAKETALVIHYVHMCVYTLCTGMCVCMSVCTLCVCTCICVNVYILYAYIHLYAYVHVCVCGYIMCVRACLCTHSCSCVQACTGVCMLCVHVYVHSVYLSARAHVCKHTEARRQPRVFSSGAMSLSLPPHLWDY